ncbi:MAG: EF-hand domain-containing protein, partial [Chloroflexota bacterium]
HWKAADKDGNGSLSREEAAASMPHVAENFDKLDTNKDGQISVDEMRAMHKDGGRHSPEQMKQHFKDADKNADGAIDLEEAKAGMPMLAEHFADVDTNKDGKVSPDEMRAHHQRMHPDQAPPPPPAQGWGYREDTTVRVAEHEQVAFAAAATVTTADGRQINIEAAFAMARDQVMTESTSLRAGDAARDPLVLALGGGAPSLGSGTSAVDVNNDGTAEQVASLATGSVYLVRDLNGNGIVDNGSEMFGPATNSGYGELSALDSDRNGWIDEGDAAFAGLGVWSGEAGAAIQSLASAGVGALATASAVTPFSYASGGGSLSASSIFLYENGGAGISGDLNLVA